MASPNTTLYVHNLNERIKIPALKEALTEIFSECGTITDIIAKTSLKRKGQAFIVFEESDAVDSAIEDIEGFELFGKEMKLERAKSKSDAQVLRDTPDEFETHKRARMAERERKQAQEAASTKRPAQAAAAEPQGLSNRPTKIARASLKPTGGATAVIPDEYLPPNKILFVQNIPEGYDVDGLTAIFSRFDGFKEVRLVPGRAGIAFVEYEGEQGAISAKERTAGMALGEEGKSIKVTFQRS